MSLLSISVSICVYICIKDIREHLCLLLHQEGTESRYIAMSIDSVYTAGCKAGNMTTLLYYMINTFASAHDILYKWLHPGTVGTK